MPDTKTWWRNFLGEGGPISLHLDGVAHTGHGVARRDGSGAAAVTVHFDGGPPVD
jgi:hypothetical protein